MVFFSALLSLPFRFSSSPRMAVQFLLFLFCRCFLGFVFKVYVVGPIWGSLAPALGERVCWHDVNISGSHCYIWWFPLLLGTVWLTLPCIPFLFASVGGFSWLCQQFLSFFACCMYVFWSLLWFSGHCWALICSVLFCYCWLAESSSLYSVPAMWSGAGAAWRWLVVCLAQFICIWVGSFDFIFWATWLFALFWVNLFGLFL